MACELSRLQAQFQAYLLDQPSEFAAALRAGPGLGPTQRLAIYHAAYRARLVDTLRDSYAHTASYLGEDWFEREARAYLIAHPSRHASLRWFGQAFPAWLGVRHAADPEIAELAALDWALRSAFDSADAPVLDMAALAALPAEAWARVGLRLQPGCQCLPLRHNTVAIWQALDQDEPPPPSEALPQDLTLLVWRRGVQPHFRSLAPLEAAAVAGLQAGLGFAALCERLGQQFPEREIAAEVGQLLRRWIEEELLSELIDPDRP